MFLLALATIPVIVVVVVVAFDPETCRSAVPFAWACNVVVRIPAAMALFGVLIAMLLKAATFLARVQNYGVNYDKY
jgi:hypothetical protein